jgi:putative ATPase
MDLFGDSGRIPLASRMVPRNLDDFVGQEHLLGKGRLLRRLIETDRVSSLVLYGPPGCGKSSIAQIIAERTESEFRRLNAPTSGVAELRKINQAAKRAGRIILFVDEIYYWSKLQQSCLLTGVEDGTITLIGATLYNPFFSIIPALVSRSRIFELKPLTEEDIKEILTRSLSDRERGLGQHNVRLTEDALGYLSRYASGDARRALNALELGVLSERTDEGEEIEYDLDLARECLRKQAIYYTKSEHYDTISAFIKSMRGSDPDASIYWLAKMISAGEDPRFIARRIVICASEDVGNADPQALVVANAALAATEAIGLPEAKIPLAQATLYVATAPKSNSCYISISRAMQDVENEAQGVPEHLKQSGYPGAKRLKRGEEYVYPHEHPEGYVSQSYLPHRRRYYSPSSRGFEKIVRQRMARLKRKE